MRNIFLDTGGILATVNKRDALHKKAVKVNKAIETYKKYTDKEWGLTDITSFVVMQQEGLNEASTGNHHFKQFGFRILL